MLGGPVQAYSCALDVGSCLALLAAACRGGPSTFFTFGSRSGL